MKIVLDKQYVPVLRNNRTVMRPPRFHTAGLEQENSLMRIRTDRRRQSGMVVLHTPRFFGLTLPSVHTMVVVGKHFTFCLLWFSEKSSLNS